MEIAERFREEYKAVWRRKLEEFMDDLGFRMVRFRLSLDGNSEELAVMGPGYSVTDRGGYKRLERVLKELEQKYNIRLGEEKRSW